MKINETGLKLIEQEEGLRLHVYLDSVGRPTIGYGHLILPGENFSTGLTQAAAEQLLHKDVAVAEEAVNKHAPNANQNQFSALCDFAYNLGTGSLAQMLAHGFDQIPNQILKWDHAGGKELSDLKKRRMAELQLFNTPVQA